MASGRMASGRVAYGRMGLRQDGLRQDGLQQDGLRQDGLRQDGPPVFGASELLILLSGSWLALPIMPKAHDYSVPAHRQTNLTLG